MNLTERVNKLEAQVAALARIEPPLAAEFIDTATSTTDDLRVVVRDWDAGEHSFGPVVWRPRVDDVGDPVFPTAGDPAYILQATDGRHVVVEWKPA